MHRYSAISSRWSLAAAVVLILALWTASASGGDWPQWLGPERDGTSDEEVHPWQGKAKEVWRLDVGIGYSAMAVRDGKAFTMGNVEDRDVVYCLDAQSGKEIWTASYPCPANAAGYYGPRCTPAVDKQNVYTVSHQGVVKCYRIQDGKELWSNDLRKMGIEGPKWGISTSPLLRDETILIDVGPIMALRKSDGKVVMETERFKPGYSSPVVFQRDGKNLVAGFNADGLVVAEEASGTIVAQTPWKTPFNVNAATPLVFDSSRLLVTSGYRVGTGMFDLSEGELSRLWHSKALGSQCNQLMPHDGYLYGFDGNVRGRGGLKCIDLAAGAQKWQAQDRRKLGIGSVLLAKDKLVVLGEHGWLMIADPSPEGFKPLCEERILEGDYCWTPPVLANGKLYCRDYDRKGGSTWVCIDVSGK